MYEVGTSILYGRTGVCRVEGIGTPPFQKNDGHSYYTLRAVFSNCGELIYIPVDTPASMRPLIGSGEAAGYLDLISTLKPKAFSSRRPADLAAHYQEMLTSCEPKDCLLLIKEVYWKQKSMKKLGQVDTRYLKIAERMVCEELAAALDTKPESIRRRLYAAMDRETAELAPRPDSIKMGNTVTGVPRNHNDNDFLRKNQ